MHLKRWLTSIIAVPILFYLIGFAHRWMFYSLVYLVSLAGLSEFYRITAPDLTRHIKWLSYLLTFLLFSSIYGKQFLITTVIISLWAFVPMAFYMLGKPSSGRQQIDDMGKLVWGPVYIVLPLAMLLQIDIFYPGNGNLWIFFLLAVIFASDTGAFYLGKLFGKHKLYEAISPGKTWEGAVGGVLCSIIAAVWFLHLIHIHRINASIILLVIAMSISGQIGDLAESMLKRIHGLKDSGRILPGHGGVLDRIDGLLFAIPLLFMYLVFIMK